MISTALLHHPIIPEVEKRFGLILGDRKLKKNVIDITGRV